MSPIRWFFVTAVVVLALFFAPLAFAHKAGWCGHSVVYFQQWSYGQAIQYREIWVTSWQSGGRHIHEVKTQYAPLSGSPAWVTIHYHQRDCGSTHS